jgi:hypothetical protein
MSRLQEPLTLPKHSKLLEEINQTIVDLKFHDDEKPMMLENKVLEDLRKKHKKHSWQDVCELLGRCYAAINQQRENPRKY